MTDLHKLIEAVEDGVSTYDLPIVSIAIIGSRWTYICNAYNGSLDAAKALHEELLPGWEWDAGSFDASVSKGSTWFIEHVGGTPARAWLLAILKAYEAQQ